MPNSLNNLGGPDPLQDISLNQGATPDGSQFPDTSCQESKDAYAQLREVMRTTTPKRQPGDLNRSRLNPDLRNLLHAGGLVFAGREAIESLALNSPKPRRQILLSLLAMVAGVTAITLRPKSSGAESPDNKKPPALIQVYERGGSDWRYSFNWMGDTNHQHGELKAPPFGLTAMPANFMMVPSGKTGVGPVPFLDKRGDQTASFLIDMKTNGHATGTHRSFTGSDDMMMPSVDAMAAYAYNPNDPYALIANDLTFPGGLVVPSQTANLAELAAVANPNKTVDGDQILPTGSYQGLVEHRQKELKQNTTGLNAKGKRLLPSMQSISQARLTAQSAAQEIQEILAIIAKVQQNQNNSLTQLGIITTELAKDEDFVPVVDFELGGHDTHGSINGAQQMALTQTKVIGSDATLSYAESQNAPVTIVWIADFGRAPTNFNNLNTGDPSAHHEVGRILMMGAGVPKGGIVVGVVDDQMRLKAEIANYADAAIYRRSQAGLDDVEFPVNVELPDKSGPDVIQKLVAKKTAGAYGAPLPRGPTRRDLFNFVRKMVA